MKKTIYSFCAILMAACLCFTTKANAGSTCFTDGFGYVWRVSFTGSGTYTGTGTVDIGGGVIWNVWAAGSATGQGTGNVEFHAINPNPDGCFSYSDSFTYWGTASITHGSFSSYGSGTWSSYCYGGVLNSGDWYAAGPCGSGAKSVIPNGPARHNNTSKNAKNSSNTVCFNDGFYNWTITYTDQGNGNYSVTGGLLVDGNHWSVYGWGTGFAGHMGSVELHASNDHPDGCNTYSDSFTYWGNAQITGHGQNTTFYGSGNWTSYCFGGVLFNGTWAAQGPCGSLKPLPYGPAKHGINTSKNAKNSMNTVCFNDGFYNWNVTYTDQGGGYYTCTGTVNVDGTNWTVWGQGDFVNHTSTDLELHAANPNPDGCSFYVDSFTYYDGNVSISGNGSSTTFSGYGSWVNYCFGSVLGYGSWSAYGPCGTLKSLPYGPAKHSDAFSMKVSPNPMKTSSTVTYSLTKQSQVKITVYNYMQQPVKQVVNKTESAGKHSYVIDGSSLTNGVYRVVAVVNGKSYTSSLQVVR